MNYIIRRSLRIAKRDLTYQVYKLIGPKLKSRIATLYATDRALRDIKWAVYRTCVDLLTGNDGGDI
jgi:hypothetical protein